MTTGTIETWNQHTRHTLQRYDEALLRQVAHKLCKPRNQWPASELLDRIVAAYDNAATLDRRLKDLPVECRRILAVIGRSRETRWPLGSLVEILVALGAEDGLAPIVTLLETGLLLPELLPFGSNPDDEKISTRSRLRSFEAWLGRSEPMPMLLASPVLTRRVLHEDLGISGVAESTDQQGTILEADGLDWPLRLGVLWQQVLEMPLRHTQQGDYFKRDYERLQCDSLLSMPPNDVLTAVPDPGFFAAALAKAHGLLTEQQSELRAGEIPAAWKGPLPALLVEFWTSLSRVRTWNPVNGHNPTPGAANPYPAAYQLTMLILAQAGEKSWISPRDIEAWIKAKHPYWAAVGATPTDSGQPIGIEAFLLGIAYSLRLVNATKGPDGGWLVRLSMVGRWAVGLIEQPPALPTFPQTLLVQPNLEILAYRQGLTPELIVSLTKIATWKVLGAACTLQLEPHSVYRALEMGESQHSITRLLEGHGMKALPSAVLDSLKTWSSKRERITVYTAGALFEFATPAEMNDAIARGLPATRLTDRLAIVANENDIPYKHFRLTGTRDYTLPPEKCVDVDADGVTLNVDLTRSDLLLDTELQRFSEPVTPTTSDAFNSRAPASPRTTYRLTPASIAAARQQGTTLGYLQTWFAQRTGLPIPAAALLLMTGADTAPVELRRQLVLHVASEHLADGLQQWPGTRSLIVARLGPATLAVDEKDVAALTQRLTELGIKIHFEA